MCVPCFSLPRNPNYPHAFSQRGPEFAAPWPDFLPGAHGENYKEFSARLPNRKDLKKADCSFWSKYIRSLKAPAGREPGACVGQGEGSTLCIGPVRASGSQWALGGHQHLSPPHRRGVLLAKASCSGGAGEGSERQNTRVGERELGGLWDG